MNEQQRKIMDYVDSQQIDWSKPVEYVHSMGTWPVVASFEQPNGTRLVVVRDDYDGTYSDVRYPSFGVTFRNVRRKVKREAWLLLWPDGTIHCYYDSGAKNISAPLGGEVRHIEWESDADE